MQGMLVERLEGRRLWNAGGADVPRAANDLSSDFPGDPPPVLQSVLFIGPPGQATGVALTFSEPLDPSGATNVGAYEVLGAWAKQGKFLVRRPTPLASATYDDATMTVTLVPDVVPFDAQRQVQQLTIRSSTVRGADGVPLEHTLFGPDQVVVPVRHVSRRAIAYTDANGSRVRLRLQGPGRLRLAQKLGAVWVDDFGDGWSFSWTQSLKILGRGEGQQLWVEGATADTVLTGTVRRGRGRGSDAATSFAEIINPGGARLDLLNDPAFHANARA